MKKYLVNVNGTDYEITLEEVKDGADFPKKAPQAAAPAEDRTGPENKWGTYRDHPDGIHMIRKKKCMTGSKY